MENSGNIFLVREGKILKKAFYCTQFERRTIMFNWESSGHVMRLGKCYFHIRPNPDPIESRMIGKRYPQLIMKKETDR